MIHSIGQVQPWIIANTPIGATILFQAKNPQANEGVEDE